MNCIRNHKKTFGAVVIIIILFVLWGPPAVMDKTSTPDFCNLCHVMNYHHDAWFMTGLHRNIKCVDCHLPNRGFISHYVWKGIDGMKDVIFFHADLIAEPIEISSHGKETIQDNCVRCHDGMVAIINTEDRYCWDCHRRANHKTAEISANNK